MPTYQEFIDSLRTHKYPDNIYYSSLVYFKEEIMLDIGKTSQGLVARKLRMHQTRFSPITFLLKLDISLDSIRDLEDYIAIMVEGQDDDNYTSSM
jgi:hypothetical protein